MRALLVRHSVSKGNIVNNHLIGYVVTFVCAALIGVGVGTLRAPARAPAICIKALDSADANFKVLGQAMTSASKVVTAATGGDNAGVAAGVNEINAAGSRMTLTAYRTARDACRADK